MQAALVLPSFVMHFSKEIFDAFGEVFGKSTNGKTDQVGRGVLYSPKNVKPENLSPFRLSLSVKLDNVHFHVDFEDGGENIPNASFLLGGVNIRLVI